MIVYGANPVLEAIRANPDRIRWVALAREERRRHQRIADAARSAGVSVRFVPMQEVTRLAGGAVHNGVVAEISAGSFVDFEEAVDRGARLVLLLDGVTDPQNFGAVLRVADAFGADLVVIPEHDSVGITPTVVKASAGASAWVAVAQVTNLSRAIERLKAAEFWVYGAAEDGEPADRIDLSGKVALVLGSEGKGIRRNVLEHCDRRIAIPMRGHVDSLNVAAAAAVLAYEVHRQGRTGT